MRFRNVVACLVVTGFIALWLPPSDAAAAARGCSGALNPVCGIKPGGPQTYDNSCAARADGARVMHIGQCQPILCSGMGPKVALQLGIVPSQPMCGRDPLTHAMMTYPNSCAAEFAQATWLHNGPCRVARRR